MIGKVSPYWKAIIAALLAFLSALSTALVDDVLSGQDWITAAVAFLVALGVVWVVPNKTKP